MKIQLRKITDYKCEYSITRDDKSVELISLETKVFLLHDICHYAVEKNLQYTNGFWGMLSQGYSFKQLFGKENPLTTDLRFVEQLVGPIQSTFLKQIPRQS